MVRGINSDEVAEPNCFAVESTVAAFTQGGEWLDELRAYLCSNKALVYDYLRQEIPGIKPLAQHATYLLWLDCSAIAERADDLSAFLRSETGLYVTAGTQYRGNGKQFLRMNVACPASRVRDGLARLKSGTEAFVRK